jgi:hypothetical protein
MSAPDPWEPCPFCKSTNVAVHADHPALHDPGRQKVWLKCRACDSVWFVVKR